MKTQTNSDHRKLGIFRIFVNMTFLPIKQYCLLAAFLLPVFLFSISCKKRIIDFRKAYVGKYTFHLHQVSDTLGQGTFDTSYHYIGEIKTVNRDDLLLDWFNGNKVQLIVNKKGELFEDTEEIGVVDDDAIWLEYHIEESGSPSVTTHYKLTGEQID